MLSEEMRIPLLRYRSGDYGKTFSYREVVDTLRRCGYHIEPDLKLPFVAVSGRGKSLPVQHGELFPEAVKEAVYANRRLANAVTGNFRLSEQKGLALIEFQLRQGRAIDADDSDDFLMHLLRYSRVKPHVVFHSYATFPYSMELDFERKFHYL